MKRFKVILTILSTTFSCYSQSENDTIFPFEKSYSGSKNELGEIEIIEYAVPLIDSDEGTYHYDLQECGYSWKHGIRLEDTIPELYNKYRIGVINEKYGVFSEKREEIIAAQYDTLYKVKGVIQTAFVVKKDDKYGLIGEHNKIIWPVEYDHFKAINFYSCHHKSGLFLAKKGDKFGLLKIDGTEKVKVEYDYVYHSFVDKECPSKRELTCVSKDGKFGFVNDSGTPIIPLIYDDILTRSPHSEYTEHIFAKYKGKYGIIDVTNRVIIPFKYEGIEKINLHFFKRKEQFYTFKMDGKWGIMGSDEREIVAPAYDAIKSLPNTSHGKFAIMQENLWGVADTNGNIPIQPQFEDIESLRGDYYVYISNGKKGFVSRNGEIQSEAKYDEIQDVEKHLALVVKGENKGIFNLYSGKEIVPPIYKIPWDYYGEYDLYWAKYLYLDYMSWKIPEGKFGLIDSSGKIIAPFVYDTTLVSNYQNEVIFAKKDGLHYVMSMNGEILTEGYDNLHQDQFSYDHYFILTEKDSLFGLLSPKAKLMAKPQYEKIVIMRDFSNRNNDTIFFKLYKKDKVGVMNTDGAIIIPCQNDYIKLDNNQFEVVKGIETALYDLNGKLLAPFENKIIRKISSKYDIVTYADSMAIVNKEGLRMNQMTYLYILKLKNEYVEITVVNENYKPHSHYWSEGYGEWRYGLLDTNLNVILEPKFKEITLYNSHLGSVKNVKGGYHFFDFEKGVEETEYNEIRHFPNGFFEVEESEYVEGICDSLGNVIIKPQFQKIKYYDGTFAAVKKNGLYGFCDGKGNIIVDYQYKKVKYLWQDFLCVAVDDKFGVVNRKGEEVIPFEYQTYKSDAKGNLLLKKGKKWYKLTERGRLKPVK